MVKLLILIFSAQFAFADGYVTGQDINVKYVKKTGGTYDFSYARGGLTIGDSKFRTLTGHKAKMEMFRVDNSVIDDVDVSGANLQNSVWSASKFGHAVFRGADLRGATFFQIEVANGVFDKADLRGTDLAQATFANCSFRGARYDGWTKLPFGQSQAEEWGMIYVP